MMKTRLRTLSEALLNSYSQVFFSDNRLYAIIIAIVTFIDVYVGLAGLLSIATTIVIARAMGFDKTLINKGLYGFNSLLVGLCLGVWFSPGIILYLLVVLASLLTLFIALNLQGIIGKYKLPFLSLPFIISAWVVMLASSNLSYIGLSERGIFTINEIYTLGGSNAVDIYKWWNDIQIPGPLRTYLLSLGAILFQYNLLAGIIIAIGLLMFSRIAFSLSLFGFFTAYFFYEFTGADITELSYSYIGFNYILTSVAVGGFFVIPSLSSYIWSMLLVPIVAIVTMSLSNVFAVIALPIYALPFNIVVLLFLYSLALRTTPGKGPVLVTLQQNSPEKNLYLYQNDTSRFRYDLFPLFLPFFGKWRVLQDYNGKETHIGQWRHALDFVITGNDGLQYSGKGSRREDYYCFNKPVTAPADGIIEFVTDAIDDNEIGTANVRDNWGNTVIIRHADWLYTSLNHLKKESVNVKPGERVKKGQQVARCGNSGRSPYPHLHFQVQTLPAIGSPTLEYPFANYIRITDEGEMLTAYTVPFEEEEVSVVETNTLLSAALDMKPGKKMIFITNEGEKEYEEELEVFTNELNYSYIENKRTGDIAYFTNDGSVHNFSQYYGNRRGLLYYFFMGCFRVPVGFYPNMTISDVLPVDMVFKNPILFFNDFVAPFSSFLKPGYQLNYRSVDSQIDPALMILDATVTKQIFGIRSSEIKIEMQFTGRSLSETRVFDGGREILSSKILEK